MGFGSDPTMPSDLGTDPLTGELIGSQDPNVSSSDYTAFNTPSPSAANASPSWSQSLLGWLSLGANVASTVVRAQGNPSVPRPRTTTSGIFGTQASGTSSIVLLLVLGFVILLFASRK
jgi:hypothetical protein